MKIPCTSVQGKGGEVEGGGGEGREFLIPFVSLTHLSVLGLEVGREEGRGRRSCNEKEKPSFLLFLARNRHFFPHAPAPVVHALSPILFISAPKLFPPPLLEQEELQREEEQRELLPGVSLVVVGDEEEHREVGREEQEDVGLHDEALAQSGRLAPLSIGGLRLLFALQDSLVPLLLLLLPLPAQECERRRHRPLAQLHLQRVPGAPGMGPHLQAGAVLTHAQVVEVVIAVGLHGMVETRLPLN